MNFSIVKTAWLVVILLIVVAVLKKLRGGGGGAPAKEPDAYTGTGGVKTLPIDTVETNYTSATDLKR